MNNHNLVTEAAFMRFFHAYQDCALWAEVDEEGVPLDDGRDRDDFNERARLKMRGDCFTFLTKAAHIWQELEGDMFEQRQGGDGHFYDLWELAGHDFWLTRNGHGAGFWDRADVWGEYKDVLSDMAQAAGDAYIYVGSDGMVHHG